MPPSFHLSPYLFPIFMSSSLSRPAKKGLPPTDTAGAISTVIFGSQAPTPLFSHKTLAAVVVIDVPLCKYVCVYADDQVVFPLLKPNAPVVADASGAV